jgi:hypothetical protein
MGSHLAIRHETFSPSEDQSWLGSAHGTNECDSITLDSDAFLTLFPTGIVPSGVVLYKHSSGLYRPFGSVSADEVQTITEGGTGLTSFVLHFQGQDTTSLVAASTAAQVQAALEALSTIGAGNVTVTGSASGPYSVTFVGDLADVDQPAMTATPTGGTGTVTIATGTAGGTDTDTAAGHLFTTTDLGGTTAGTVDKCTAALFWHGEVIVANLPENAGLTTGARADLNQIRYI